MRTESEDDDSAPSKAEEFGDKLSEIACAIADDLLPPRNLSEQCRGEIIPFDQKITAFKVLTNYYAMIHKISPPEDEKRGAFDEYRRKIDTPRTTGTGGGRGRKPASVAVIPRTGTDE